MDELIRKLSTHRAGECLAYYLTASSEEKGKIFDWLASKEILYHSESKIVKSVIWVLGEMGEERAVGYLMDKLKTDEFSVRREAIRALWKLGSKSKGALEVLKALYKKEKALSLKEEIEEAIAAIEDSLRGIDRYVTQQRKLLSAIQELPKGKEKISRMRELVEFELLDLARRGYITFMDEQGNFITDIKEIIKIIKEDSQIIAGIPSYKEGKIIEVEKGKREPEIKRSLTAAYEGLRRYAKEGRNTLLVNMNYIAEEGSTKPVFIEAVKQFTKSKEAVRRLIKKDTERTQGKMYFLHIVSKDLGKGNNCLNLFRITLLSQSFEACVLVDADLRNITPEWITSLAKGILTGRLDFVTPVYRRHWSDASLTHHIARLIAVLLGWLVEQPIGGDFGFGPRFLEEIMYVYVSKEGWLKTTYQYGIDIFMTMLALGKHLRIGKVNLGRKIHAPSGPKIGKMSLQVIDSAFSMFLRDKELLFKNDRVSDVEEIETDIIVDNSGIQQLKVNFTDFKRIRDTFLKEVSKEKTNKLLKQVLEKRNYNGLSMVRKYFEAIKKIKQYRIGQLISNDLWTDLLIDLICAYAQAKTCLEKDEIVVAVRALYFGRIASIMYEALGYESEEERNRIANKRFNDAVEVMSIKRKYLARRLKEVTSNSPISLSDDRVISVPGVGVMREMSVSLEVKEKLIEEFIEALGSVSASSPFKAIYRRALVYYRLTYL